MKHYRCHLLLFVSVLGGACLAQSDNVSLGDLARKNQTHRKSVMVFDDENTRRTSANNDTASISANSKTTVAQPVTAEAAKADPRNSASTSDGGQLNKLKKQLDSLKQQQSVWSNSAKEYEEKLVNETSDFRRQVYEEALGNDKQNVQLYQQKIDQVQTELTKAQENSHPSNPAHADGSSSGGRGNLP
jgi:hypothetical protein